MTIRREALDLLGRGRYLASKADRTVDEVNELIQIGFKLLEMIMDGFAFGLYLEPHAVLKLSKQIVSGEGGEIPMKATVDMTYAKYPSKVSVFVGGPYDPTGAGHPMEIPDKYLTRKSITLQDKDGDGTGETYVWNGWVFQWDGKLDVVEK